MMSTLPPRGQDPQLDAVVSVIERCAMKDPDTLLVMLQAILRFLRTKEIPGIVISFNDLALAGTPAEHAHALNFALNCEDRQVILFLIDATNRAGVIARTQAKMPQATIRVIEDEKKGLPV